jgi:hypothetical protein
MAPPPAVTQPRFEPCASTASLFLYAQGSTILCLHHDTLAIERRFQSHQENIEFISVDNVSERGAGRLVVSYDVGQTAIVWDIFTGTEIARFASFEQLRVASWMRNGNVAFGEISIMLRLPILGLSADWYFRQWQGRSNFVRTTNIRAFFCAHYLRPDHSTCSCYGLSHFCNWVC